jgi:putative oxidoreductase
LPKLRRENAYMADADRNRDLALLVERIVLGGYLAAHGAQKLFGSFGGPGLEPVATAFETIGLRPGSVTARAAGLSELVGGALTMLGMADPLGPVSLVGTMAVASSTHLDNGPFTADHGYELPLTNFATALALAATGPGRYSVDAWLGRNLPKSLARLSVAGAVGASTLTLAMVLRARKVKQVTTEGQPVVSDVPDPNLSDVNAT